MITLHVECSRSGVMCCRQYPLSLCDSGVRWEQCLKKKVQNHFSRASLNHVGKGQRRGCGKGVHVRARVHMKERFRELGWTFVPTGNIENESSKQHKKFMRWLLPPFDTCVLLPFLFPAFLFPFLIY